MDRIRKFNWRMFSKSLNRSASITIILIYYFSILFSMIEIETLEKIQTIQNKHFDDQQLIEANDCTDLWIRYGIQKSGNYTLILDRNDLATIIDVECDMNDRIQIHEDFDRNRLNKSEKIFEIKTIIHHDSEEPRLVQGYESPGSFERNIIYNQRYAMKSSMLKPIIKIIENSFSCQQFIRWDCKGSVFSFWYQHYHSWWLDRYARAQTYWGGAEPDFNTCGCFPYCYPTTKNSTCNCDANIKTDWLEDSGLLLIKDRLPVRQLRFGDTGESYEIGRYYLGPLICRTFGHRNITMGEFEAPITITSPGFPHRYPSSFRRYEWSILVQKNQSIEMVFSEYDIIHYGSYISVPGCRHALEVDILKRSSPNATDWFLIHSIRREKSTPPYFVTDGDETLFRMRFVTCNQNYSRKASTFTNAQHKGFRVEFRKSTCSTCPSGQCHIEPDQCIYIFSEGYPYPYYLLGKSFDRNPRLQSWNLSTIEENLIQIEFNDFDVISTPGQHNCDADLVTIQENGTKNVNYCNINRFNIGKFLSETNRMELILRTTLKKVGNSRGIHATVRSVPKLITSKPRWSKNAAEGKPTDQSSTRSSRESSLAVDNNFEQKESTKCSSTNYEREPWWRVNLQKRHRIYGIQIFGYVGKRSDPAPQSSSMLLERNSFDFCSDQWPAKNYALPMPVSGCPFDEQHRWLHGIRFHAVQHDKPYDDKIRYWSDNIMLKGGATESGIEQHFCIHQDFSTNASNDSNRCLWQPGKYCIIKYGDSCPDGFQTGSITWFDKKLQNSSSKLYNYINGTMPSGNYTTHNTTIYFCCREDGDPTKPINLPRTRPFYLFQYGRICQEVSGMSEMEHYFHYEEEFFIPGSTPNMVFTTGQKLKFQDPHPRIDVTLFDRGLTLHYCYYDIADKLKGFQVLVDTTPDTFGYGKFHDTNTGIARSVNKPFLSAVECANYGTTREEFDQITLNCTQPIEGQYVIIFMKDRQDALQLCEVRVFGEETCGRPLGMATEEILDSAITASSFDTTKGLVYHPYNVRLNSFAAWCATNEDTEKFIQIDLSLQKNWNGGQEPRTVAIENGSDEKSNDFNYMTIVGIAMQGMPHGFKSYFVTNFQLLFSNDSIVWSYEEEPIGKQKVYRCVQCEAQHVDPDEVVMYNLLKPVIAKFLRVKILTFRGGPCMRLELIGCRGDKKNFCSKTLNASQSGIITSPNYPFYYAQYKSCVWNIQPSKPGLHIELDFIVLDLAPAEKSSGKCNDNLFIYHSSQQTPILIDAGSSKDQRSQLIRQQNFPKKIISNGPVTLNLRTCFRTSMTRYQGFMVKYRETDCPGCGIGDLRCSKLHNCASLCGRILSINYPLNYLNNHRCRWLIRAPPGHYFNITIEDFDIADSYSTTISSKIVTSIKTSKKKRRQSSIKTCLFDHLSFIDPSTGIVLGRYCNSRKPQKYILSNWNELLIEFSTDSSINARGFKIKYNAQRYNLLPETLPLLFPINACPTGWLHFRGYCYASFVEEQSLQWYEAEEKCAQKAKGRDGHLVSINDYLEMNVIHYWIIEQWKFSPHQNIYIGLIDTNREGFYNWSDGNPMSYTDWYRSNIWSSSTTASEVMASISINLSTNEQQQSITKLSKTNHSDSIINLQLQSDNFNQFSQPDGGAYEDCTVINFHSIHSTLNWHDVPCSLGKKVVPIRSNNINGKDYSGNSGWNTSTGIGIGSIRKNQSNPNSSSFSNITSDSQNRQKIALVHPNDGLIHSYICKMDSNSSFHQHGPRRTLFTGKFSDFEKKEIQSKVDQNRYFLCNNFEVISNLFRCDGTANCRDGSDEMEGCSISDRCLESQFQCANGHCIAIGKYCDFIDDCGDGSDEVFCVRRQCKKTSEFKCNNEQCVSINKRCDLFNDCRDQSDEDNCWGKCNLNTTFQCYYGNCIPLYTLCDRHRDCPGKFFEDEHTSICSAIINDHNGSNDTTLLSNQYQTSYRWRRESSLSNNSSDQTKSEIKGKWSNRIIDCNLTKNEIRLRRSCQDLLDYHQVNSNGHYELQPLGAENQLTIDVYCEFLNSTHAKTIINHDSEDRLYVRSSFDSPGSFLRTINYQGSFDLIVAVIENSNKCRQMLSYECSGSRFNFKTSKPNSWWVRDPVSENILGEFDQLQYQIGCRDVSHLRHCTKFQCPNDYVKCPDSYCIPYRYMCNGKWDCVGGSDEIGCARYTCPGRYKCANESSCIWLHQLCDGFRHCPLGDDEWFCDLNCPESCICFGHYIDCRFSNLTTETFRNISKEARKLDLSYNNLGPDLSMIDFSSFAYLGELILQKNNLEIIRSRKFIQLTNLYKLDLRYNRIKIIESAAFAGLQQVTTLLLDHNDQLSEIHSGAFVGLISLRRLNISNTRLKTIATNLFLQMNSLQYLTLINNQIETIEKGAFNDLYSLMALDLRENPISNFSKDMFSMLKSLRTRCHPPQDEISDCEDLMSNTVQRLILWILGFTALIGNIIVIFWRCKTKNQINWTSSTLIQWLGFSDFLMGVYLLIIASVDEHYRGRYIENSDYWKNSNLCKLCGFLSTLSSETSVVTLVFITIDRLISISFAFSNYRLNTKHTYRLLITAWIFALLISSLPLLPIEYFRGQFYSRSGVCLAFHITARQWPGWEYSVAIFLVFNLIAFIFILFCYLYMYKTIEIAVEKRRQMRAKQIRETKIGLQMALIVITNFLCWFPVIIMGLMALGGVNIPGAAYSWIAVLVLPLNSATNPLIYTLMHFIPNMAQTNKNSETQLASMRLETMRSVNLRATNSFAIQRITFNNINGNSSSASSSIDQIPMTLLMKPPPGYQKLSEFLRSKKLLSSKDLLDISYSLSKNIKEYHQMGYALDSIDCNNVFVTIKPVRLERSEIEKMIKQKMLSNKFIRGNFDDKDGDDNGKNQGGEEEEQKEEENGFSCLQAYIPPYNSYKVISPRSNDDFASNMEQFGQIIKRMLQVFHLRSLREAQNNPKYSND
ncbi:Putative G-protein coupled receptor [Sarcoptes scabiei]|uniref:Putative G-protein coupled receptor n=1 Tax=Sarcoptes scabiei TaxID=52283 RepID=A0A834REI6_SARSC|nr:Putative G-protein coupled receptor [Sarcoptes scabiei]